MPNILNTSKYGDLDISKARTNASQFGDGSTYALTFNINGTDYTYVPKNVAQNGGLTAGDNTYLLPYFTDQKNLNSFSKDSDKVDLSGSGVENYLKNQGLSTEGFIIPSSKAGFDGQVFTQPTSTLNGSLNGLKKVGDQIVYGVTGGGGSRYLTPTGEVHNPTVTYSSILGDVFGGAGQDLANAWQDLGPVGQIAALYYGGGAISDALGGGAAAGSAGGAGFGSAADVAMMYDPVASNIAAGMTPELAAATASGFTGAAPNIGTLPTPGPAVQVASTAPGAGLDALGVTGGTSAGTPLSNVAAGNADKAALLGDAGYGAGMTAAQTAAYDAGLAAGVGSAAAAASGGAAAGSTLADILPYTTGATVAGSLISADAAKSAADAQTAAANNAIAQQQKNFETINAQQAPYRAAGYNTLNEIAKLSSGQTPTYDYMGNIVKDAAGNPIMQTGSGYLTKQFTPEDFAAGIDPGYAFRLNQGQMANQRAANVGGGALSGNTLKGLQDYTQGLASQEYGNAFNRFQTQRQNIYNTLASIAGIGQTGQTATNTAATNATNAATQLGIGSAGAQAAGQVGSANAYTNAINNATNNYTLAAILNQRGNVTTPIG